MPGTVLSTLTIVILSSRASETFLKALDCFAGSYVRQASGTGCNPGPSRETYTVDMFGLVAWQHGSQYEFFIKTLA